MKKSFSIILLLMAFISCTESEVNEDSQDQDTFGENTQNTSDIKYGPDGSRWVTRTPELNSSANFTVSNLDELENALSNASAGDVIHLEDGNYGEVRIDDESLRLHTETWTDTNVLVCPSPGANPVFSSLRLDIPNVTWSGITVGGAFYLDTHSSHSRLVRTRFSENGIILIRGASDIEFVEVVMLERGEDGDRMQIAPRNGLVPADILIDGCWIEATTVVSAGQHSDTIQTLGMTGTFIIRNSYIGAAGNNATIQAGMETQPNGVPYAKYEFYDVFLGGAEKLGNGNVIAVGRENIYQNVEFDINAKIRRETANNPILQMTGCRIEQSEVLYPNGDKLSERFPDNQFGVDIVVPTFVEPSWW